MRIISRRRLREFEKLHPPARPGLQLWYHTARARTWSIPADVKKDYASASIIAGNRVVFNIAGNNDRLVVKFNYGYGVGYIRFVGTHAEYDKIDAATIQPNGAAHSSRETVNDQGPCDQDRARLRICLG